MNETNFGERETCVKGTIQYQAPHLVLTFQDQAKYLVFTFQGQAKGLGLTFLKRRNINLVYKENPDFAVTSKQVSLEPKWLRSTVRARLGQNLARKASIPARPNTQGQ